MATQKQLNNTRTMSLKARTPEARRKAVKSYLKTAGIRKQLAQHYGESPLSFAGPRLVDTIKRLKIPLRDLPVEVFAPLPPRVRTELLDRRAANGGNGAEPNIVGIPLEAIPERAPSYKRGAYNKAGKPSGSGHPNAELVGKIIDLLAREGTTDKIAERLLNTLDKLVR